MEMWQFVFSSFFFLYTSIELYLLRSGTCKALPGFEPTLIGGDGNLVQICMFFSFQTAQSHRVLNPFSTDFVGYWPAENTIVVSHEGTDPTKL